MECISIFESGNLVLSGDNGFTLVKANESLGNESFDPIAGLSIFPNPARNQITLASSQQIGKISVYNLLGQELLTATAANSKQLDISRLRPGLYLIQTPLGIQRIIKEMTLNKLIFTAIIAFIVISCSNDDDIPITIVVPEPEDPIEDVVVGDISGRTTCSNG